MKKSNSHTALHLPADSVQNYSPEPGVSSLGLEPPSQHRPVPGAAFATRVRDFEAWFSPFPAGLLVDQPGFDAFYAGQSYYMALFHFSGVPSTALEALYLASAALADHYLPAAEQALENAALMDPPTGPYNYLKGLLHIAKGNYDQARLAFKLVANASPVPHSPLYAWTMGRKEACQAILEHL